MEVQYKGFTVKDDGTVINKFGNEVGFKQRNKYLYINCNGKQILIHRFIWEAFNGEIPKGCEIDHINTIRDDNRLENLRCVTQKQNRNNPKTIEHYKESNKGKGVKGKIVSEETKKKISEALKGRIVSEETRKKISKVSKGKHQRKIIGQFTLDDELVCKYESAYLLGKKGFSQSMICRCCNGFIPTYKNFVWKYL